MKVFIRGMALIGNLVLASFANAEPATQESPALYVVNTHITNFRSGPTLDSDIIKRLKKDKVVIRRFDTAISPNFIPVETSDGEKGWVHSKLLTPLDSK